MWIPKTVDELISAVQTRSLKESHVLDAKEELPPSKKNFDIAKDVAAMANDGGVLIYGVGEDDHGCLTDLTPIPLKGAKERIQNVVSSGIFNAPPISIRQFDDPDDSSKGYLVVVVPQSEFAPHMVIIKEENRFYGRTATGNCPLSLGECDRLYERRQRWEVDVNALLDQDVNEPRFVHQKGPVRQFLLARPVSNRRDLLEASLGDDENVKRSLVEIVGRASGSGVPSVWSEPELARIGRWEIEDDGYLGKVSQADPPDPNEALYLKIDHDGSSHLFYGGAAMRFDKAFEFYPQVVAEYTRKFCLMLGYLYEECHYTGMVDVAIALTGLKGSVPRVKDNSINWSLDRRPPYGRDEYREIWRCSMMQMLEDPDGITATILKRLFSAMSGGRPELFGLDKT